MNDKYSTTEGKTSEKLSDEAMLSAQWKNIDWHKAEQEVNRLQIRIVKATQQKDYNAVKRLQYLLTHSFYAKALAVKRVVTNDGRKTPGVDGVLWNTPAKKMKAVLSLTDKRYRARPLRRVYIEKKDKKKKRPLGIPTMYDRAMQALYALALEPVAETTADGKSFGFRKGRCAQDACEYLFNALSRKHISPKWVLEGDIKGCFDHISHDWLLANIPMDKNILKQFLKAGFIYQRELFPTEEGTPQGGIISPILANMTLDGIEKKLVERFHTNALGKVDSRFKNAHKVNFVRYADDFVVTAATPELALEAKELIREFLAERGLELSDEKTVVTNIDDGFDFLGWNFRKYNEKLIIKPSQKAVKAIVSNISDTILRRGKAWQQDVLIMKLNEQIRGWTNYHQSVCASDAFAHLDYVLYELLWRWAKRRHPKKNKWWISTRYWHRVGNRNWVFSTENKELIRVDSTAIVRHTKIKATANPFLDEAYFQKRKFDKGMHRLTGKFKMIWKNQNGLCYHCGMPMDVMEEREIFYLAPKAKAGMELFGDEYIDNNLVFCSSNGRPMESQVINRAFNKLIKENGLPHVVFHSLRHSSITYKLKLNGGDMKSVQGDSGHAQVKMVADVYSHIIDEDRCINAQRLEEAFYSSKTPDPVEDTEPKTADTAVTESDESDAAKILELLKNPETAALLKQLAKAL